MAHLIATLEIESSKMLESNDSNQKDFSKHLTKILNSKLFDKIYLVSSDTLKNYETPSIEGVKITLIRLDITKPSEELVPELYVILKKNFMQDKIQDLDIAVNITLGTGKEHAVLISTLMKLGYGIRLIDLDKDGNILEMI
jgi:hypothetical protein